MNLVYLLSMTTGGLPLVYPLAIALDDAQLKARDDFPPIEGTLQQADGTAIDFELLGVNRLLFFATSRPDGRLLSVGEADITEATGGRFHYQPARGDFHLARGDVDVEIRMLIDATDDLSAAPAQSVPSDGYATLHVLPRLKPTG